VDTLFDTNSWLALVHLGSLSRILSESLNATWNLQHCRCTSSSSSLKSLYQIKYKRVERKLRHLTKIRRKLSHE